MKYLLLMFDTEDWWTTASDDVIREQMQRHEAFARYREEQGIAMLGGGALQAAATATTIRGDGEPVVTDGPFVELKEQLGGFCIIECRDIEQAVEAARHGLIGTATEVRPIAETRTVARR